MSNILIEMKVRNHPGVMAHITGIFSRRSVNIEELICRKQSPDTTNILMLIADTGRAATAVSELSTHYDIIGITHNLTTADRIE